MAHWRFALKLDLELGLGLRPWNSALGFHLELGLGDRAWSSAWELGSGIWPWGLREAGDWPCADQTNGAAQCLAIIN